MLLENLINDHIVKKNKEDRKDKVPGHFYPSSIGYCKRKTVYQMLGYTPQDIEPQTLRIFQNGDHMHLRFQDYFEEMGIQVAPEIELKETCEDKQIAEKCKLYNISGRTDSLIKLNGTEFIVELKSINDAAFKYHLKVPYETHLCQITLYMYLSEVHRRILLYENKNTQEIKMFEIGYDEGLVNTLLEEINYINWCYKNKKLPRREGKASDSKCKNCDYRVACINNILQDGVTEDLE